MTQPISVGILLFNEVEVLDFAGPFEVLSLAQATRESGKSFLVRTISQDGNLIAACNGLKVQPDYSFDTAPQFDILIVPGGYGARAIEIQNDVLLGWLKSRVESTEIIASVCTGAFLLAKIGLLDGHAATTHWGSIDQFENDFPKVSVRRGVKFVDEGRVVTAAGISAGINMALHLVERLIGRGAAVGTAKGMEYDIVI